MSAVTAFPLLSDRTLPPAILAVRWLAQTREEGTTAISLSDLPPGNGSLPDLLRLGGITHLTLEQPPIPGAFRWEGCGGGRVVVGEADTPLDAELPLHYGHLPSRSPDAAAEPLAIAALIDLARLEDANDICSQGGGASWPHILAAAGVGRPARMPPMAAHAASGDGTQLGAWNPLPFTRHLVASLPMPKGTPPWGIEDHRGARHPVQVVEGPIGRELLTELRLDALECSRFTPLADPVAGSHWEVSRTVLDNGLVRAELDPLGQLVRFCCAGRFCSLSAPALHPLVDGLPLSASAATTVLEVGPVRARVAVSRSGREGSLHIIYTLHAHEQVLRVSASWHGSDDLVLDHPTTYRGASLRVGGELAGWQVEQSASVLSPRAAAQRAVRWALLAEAAGQGLAVCAGRALSLAAHAGHLFVQVDRATSYALFVDDQAGTPFSPARTALSLAVPGRSFTGEAALPGAFRLQGADHLVPWWTSRPNGWAGELLLAESEGRRARATLSLTSGGPSIREAWRVDASGKALDALPATAEGDGFEIDASANEILIVRWR